MFAVTTGCTVYNAFVRHLPGEFAMLLEVQSKQFESPVAVESEQSLLESLAEVRKSLSEANLLMAQSLDNLARPGAKSFGPTKEPSTPETVAEMVKLIRGMSSATSRLARQIRGSVG